MTILSYAFVGAVFIASNVWAARFSGKRFDQLERRFDLAAHQMHQELAHLREDIRGL